MLYLSNQSQKNNQNKMKIMSYIHLIFRYVDFVSW